MSQQTPKPRPQRPQAPQQQQGQYPAQQAPQYPPQQGYQQAPQYPPQQGYQQAPQYQQIPQPAPTQQPRGSNPIVTGIKWLFWPFIKVGGWILGLFNVIIHEILRSAVRLVFSIVLFAIFIAISAAYIIALMETNFDFAGAIPVMIENIMGLFNMQS
jgi:hypothetical protein